MNWIKILKNRLGIRGKLIALIAVVGGASTIGLSALINFQLRSIIFEQTLQVCRDLSVNISQVAREELLLNNLYSHTRSIMQDMQSRSIRGLMHSYVIDRQGHIVAHSDVSREGSKLSEERIRIYGNLDRIRQEDVRGLIRIVVPITVDYESKKYYLGASVFEFDKAALYVPITRIQNRILLTSVIILSLALLVAIIFAGRLSDPIEKLAGAALRIGSGELGHQVDIQQKDEIGQLALYFNRMSRQLETNQQKLAEQVAVQRELTIARDIQLSLLPEGKEQGPYRFRGYMQTADHVGGDYYDCIEVKHGRQKFWWFVIGDVAGHGLPAGLTMLMAQTAVQTALRVESKLSPDDFFVLVNEVLYTNMQRLASDRYMTAAFYRADRQGQIQYAGLHLDAIVYRAKTGKTDLLPTNGMWLGVEREISKDTLIHSLKLHTGDLLFLFTDGIIEARNASGEFFTQHRLEKLIAENGKLDLEHLETIILADLEKFLAGQELVDDVSFVMIRKI